MPLPLAVGTRREIVGNPCNAFAGFGRPCALTYLCQSAFLSIVKLANQPLKIVPHCMLARIEKSAVFLGFFSMVDDRDPVFRLIAAHG
jgi:hypothetical protein